MWFWGGSGGTSPPLFLFVPPSGLWEVLLPISGWHQARNSQALMVKCVWLKHTQPHMRIWLYRGWCSAFLSHCWIPERQKSSVIPRVTVYYTTVAGTFSLCTDQLRNLAWRGTPMWRPCRGYLWHQNEFSCWRLMTIMLMWDASQWYVDVLELNTIILQNF